MKFLSDDNNNCYDDDNNDDYDDNGEIFPGG
jgi:hypothetical protein